MSLFKALLSNHKCVMLSDRMPNDVGMAPVKPQCPAEKLANVVALLKESGICVYNGLLSIHSSRIAGMRDTHSKSSPFKKLSTTYKYSSLGNRINSSGNGVLNALPFITKYSRLVSWDHGFEVNGPNHEVKEISNSIKLERFDNSGGIP